MPNDDFGSQVKAARLAAGMSQEKLAQLAGTTQSTVDRIENGGSLRSRYRTEVAMALGIMVHEAGHAALAMSTGLDMPSITTGLATKPLPKREDLTRLVPVYASAEGGSGSMVLQDGPADYAPRPNILPNEDDLYGVVIEGTSMMKAYRPGDTAWLHPKYRERRDEACVFRRYDETTGDVSMTIKWLVDFNSTTWKVEQLNPHKEIDLPRSEWPECYRVLGKKNRA